MKILQIVPYHLPYQGGQERYVHNLSKYLAIRGHEVDICASDYPDCCESEWIDGVHIYRKHCILRVLRNPIVPGFFSFNENMREYDLIHTHNEHSTAAIAAAYYKKKYGLPLVITVHGRLIFGQPLKDAIEWIYNRTLGRMVLSSCDSIVVNSDDDNAYICSLDSGFSDKITVLHNAVDPDFFDMLDVRDISLIPGEKRKVLFVGRLIRRKGLEWLIKAFRILKDNNQNDIVCLIAGEGEDRHYFESLVGELDLGDTVLFLGNVSSPELKWLYTNSDIFVLPSLSEVCPTVALEAMYFGLPVISTDIPGIRDHFRDKIILVPPKNEVSLSDAIESLFNEPALMERLSYEGEALIRNKYVWNNVAVRYEKLYESVIDDL